MEPIIIYTADGSDERNARPLVVNHSGRPGPTNMFLGHRPLGSTAVRPPVVIYPSAPSQGQVAQVAPVPAPMAGQPGLIWQPGVGYVQNPAQFGQVPGQMQ